MKRCFLMVMALALMATPLSFAHDPAGTLKNYCEDPSEWDTHDYAPVYSGALLLLGQDGNIAGDCNGDGVPADYDLHAEFAFGGAWLTVTTVPDCSSETGHHPRFGPVSVDDTVFGGTQAFAVASDFINLVPPTDPAAPNCGDFDTDEGSVCVGTCAVTFPEGLDGTYVVFVGNGLFVPTAAGTDVEEFLSNLFLGAEFNGGKEAKACCQANCLLGVCGCCGRTADCSCDLLGQANCVCTSGGGHVRS